MTYSEHTACDVPVKECKCGCRVCTARREQEAQR